MCRFGGRSRAQSKSPARSGFANASDLRSAQPPSSKGATFRGTTFRGTTFRGTTFGEATFGGVTFGEATFGEATSWEGDLFLPRQRCSPFVKGGQGGFAFALLCVQASNPRNFHRSPRLSPSLPESTACTRSIIRPAPPA
ncbi:pentapeptide repeat-containing protein [Lysobacter sp. Hz 25]|uniref:pentapeptide repeat-containing protein n=1 Tax=Lysobacter sp. Hz 25 TaxID=3383698 RepID=UPI0038D37AB1